MNEDFGKEVVDRKGTSVKRTGRFSELPDSEHLISLRSSPSQILALHLPVVP